MLGLKWKMQPFRPDRFFLVQLEAHEAKTCQVFGMAERLHRGAIQSGESWLTDKFQIDTVVR